MLMESSFPSILVKCQCITGADCFIVLKKRNTKHKQYYITLFIQYTIHCVCYYTQSGVITAFNAFSLLFDDVLGVRYTVKKLVERNSNTASLHTYFDKSLTVQFEKSLKKKIHMRIDINPFLHAILQGSETRIFWYLFHL